MHASLQSGPIESLPWLHLHGQFTYHGEALIVGTVDGLTALRDAIDAALGSRETEVTVFASDGEGYDLTVRRAATITDMGSPVYLDEVARKIASAERDAVRKMDKHNRELWRKIRDGKEATPLDPIPCEGREE